jgi:hypothetical protein
MTVRTTIGLSDTKTIDLKLRPLYVDGRVKEYTTGTPHDITDRLFVVQRAFRLNDSLGAAPPIWIWQLANWLLVDRNTGRVSSINLPDFEPYYSNASWYRDYVAYCAVSDDGTKIYPAVSQLGRRKPIFRGTAHQVGATEDRVAQCSPPTWQRSPARITFQSTDGTVTYEIKGHAGSLVKEPEAEDASSE